MALNKIKDMKIRILSAVIGIAGCCSVIFLAPKWASTTLFSVVAGLIAYEFTERTGLVRNKTKVILSVVFSAIWPWMFYFSADVTVFVFCVFMFVALLFSVSLFEKGSDINDLFVCLFGGFFLPCILSTLVKILNMNNGKLLLVIPFVASWAPDSFAHITGSLFGKHKLLPHISPNKTVEGAFGGLAGGIAGMLIYGIVLTLFDYKIHFPLFILMGFLGAVFGLLGDLSLSYIKRKCIIKDYGNLIPGHGGVLDRFDSTLFVIPVCVFILKNATLIY